MPTEDAKLARVLETLIELANGLATLAENVKQRVAELEQAATVREQVFDVLVWQDKKGSKLDAFQVAAKDLNDPTKWQHCFNILQANHAAINERFWEPQYRYSYWIFEGAIFRQIRKPQA